MTSSRTSSRDTLLGVVLCGGRSSRMGRDKADLLTNEGRSFLDFAVDRLKPLCHLVCVSAQADRKCDYDLIPDPPHSSGPMGGIIESLTFALDQGYHACLFTPVDTPNLTVSDLESLCRVFHRDPERIACAVKESETSFYEPLIAIYPVSILPKIQAAADTKQFSLQKIIKSLNVTTIELASRSCRNLNTPTDLLDL